MSRTAPPHALVVGLGASGVAAAKLLHHQGWRVTINDRARRADLEARLAELPTGVLRSLGGHNPSLLTGTARVVVSPGVPWDLPLLVEARRRHIEVMAEVELAARELAGTPIVGVTGSNGKTTVTSLVGEMLRCAGRRVGVGGNIGTAACDLALAGGWDAVVLELSSFQLEACASLRPRVAILLNVSADHLDRHSGMNAYLAAKRRIFAKQCADDWAVLNADDPGVARLAVPAQVVRFSLVDPTAAAHLAGGALVLDGTKLLPRREVALLGDHNIANALAAALAAERLGAGRDAIAAALRHFRGLPHRHQLVAEAAGVRFVDDSKGTNIGATAAGLAGYPPESVHLILGGLGKGQDFTALRPALAGRVAQVYLIGAAADEIAAALEGHVALERCDTLEVAVGRAAAQAQDGDTVLLSPACASFDQFDDYAHRGDEFASLAREWAGSEERDGIGSQRAAGARRSLSRRKGGGSGDVPPRED
jgi:UDP-N-acetylmuramoylalanine--D-glutamate ligase